MKIRILLALLALMSSVGISASPLRLPHFFADGMVLQRGQKIPVWGWGEPGTTVKVTFCGKTAKTTVRPDGTWTVLLPKQRATFRPQELTVTSLPAKSAGRSAAATSAITLRNILIGDVYLCSGQSNMELPIRRCMDKVADLVRDYSNPNIRYLKLPHQYNYVRPNDDCRTLGWQDITPQNCAEVSAICYFMARHLQEVKSVPIGIVNSAVGGTRVESWMPQATLARFPAYASEFGKRKYQQTDWPDSVARVEARAWREWDARLAQTDTVLFRWRQPDYHFDGWKPVDIFSDWGRAGNGSYWFRHTVSLPAACAGQEAVLRLGAMKDADSVFVNGTWA